jgi:tetratricopeptide (TPR) repeat protein
LDRTPCAAMTRASRKIVAPLLAAFSALAFADPQMPKRPPPAPAHSVMPKAPPIGVDFLRQLVGKDEPRCATVKVNGPATFRKRTLVEIPDITEPELKLANRLMSSGCFARAVDQLDNLLKKDAENFHADYIIARMTWMKLSTSAAERVLKQTLAKHPGFASAKVLLAGIRLEQGRWAESAAIFDEVDRNSPADMWVFMGRLRLEAARAPSEDLRTRLMEIVRNPSFPPNAREVAGGIAEPLSQDPARYEELLRAMLEVESNLDMACKVAKLAVFLGHMQGRSADVITLLESPRSREGNCLGLKANRIMLAQAYLLEAAKLSPGPSPANKRMLDRVDEIVEGDYVDLVAYTRGADSYPRLRLFLDPHVQPDKKDAKGVTMICNAIARIDVETVQQELAIGADAKQRCGSRSLVELVMALPSGKRADDRREILQALMQRLPTLTKANMDYCRDRAHGDCHRVLLPVMEPYTWLFETPK